MSSPKYASPLYLNPETSRAFIALFLMGHLGAMVSVLFLNFSWESKAALLIILAISLVAVLRGKGMGNVSSLTWKDGGEWALKLDNGNEYETQLLPSSYVSPWLVVLNFNEAEDHRSRSVTLFRDALDPESFRRLRVRMGVEKASDQ